MQGFSFPHVSKKTACLISLSFVQCVRKRKGQAGREGREVNHDKVSTAFWSLSLHVASLLLPAWLCCAGSTQDELEAHADLVSLGLLGSLLPSVFTSILRVTNCSLMVRRQECSEHQWGRFLGGSGEVFQVPLGLSEYDLLHFKDRKNHLSPGLSSS